MSPPPAARAVDVPGFESVVRLDLGSTTAFLAIHLTVGGRSFGGIRVTDYADEGEALEDACALAAAMSRKLLLPGLRGGGAKAVVLRPASGRREALRRLGAYIRSLGGRYHCGGDLGFTDEDHAVVACETQNIAEVGLGVHTARSVRSAMEAACAFAGSGPPGTWRVAVQGLGDVGRPLADGLRAEGATVIASDVRPVEGWDLVSPAASILAADCDVFAPCARGGVLDGPAGEALRARVVCGGANNPLAGAAVADLLDRRGIVYVPDFVANVGAAIQGVSAALGESDRVGERMQAVGALTAALLEEASATGRTPLAVALERADAAIAAARG